MVKVQFDGGFGTTQKLIPVPCGKCPECKNARFNAWRFRLEYEDKRSINPLFVTLTYDDEHLPYSNLVKLPVFVKGRPTLKKKDVQDFMKRLRKAHARKHKTKLTYFCVGEYGTKTQRPHYHLILYNLEDPALIEKTWKMGFDYTLPLLGGGISYVLKYIQKGGKIDKKTDSRCPEFSLISKGIGTNYLTDAMVNYHRSDVAHCHVTLKGGIKLPIPKYFKEKIYTEDMGDLRSRVTDYLKFRSEEIQNRRVQLLRQIDPNFTTESALTYLEYCKQNVKLAPRLQETL